MAAVARTHLVRLGAVVAVLVVANFWLPRLLPGSPLAEGTADVAFLPATVQADLRRTYGLDLPLTEQFRLYLAGLLRGDLGRSLASHRPVASILAERLPWTGLLVGCALLAATAIGVTLGTLGAWRPGSRAIRWLGPVVVAVGALPEFLVAMVLIAVFGTWLQLLPAGGAATPFFAAGGLAGALDVARHAVLPVATLVAALAPAFFLLSRNALVAVIGQPYLLTARGKGLSEGRVLWHAWRNALPPVLTLFGLRLAFVVTGAAVVERVFAYPGMGMLLFEAVARRDYPVLQGIFLVASAAVVAVSVMLDLAAGVLDPRAREERT
ncbi:MAG: ABC transporter permease [Armatimonadota bacterium]|nr:ABC transporter permease [Armatimonadota bacterium]MDR5696869.1 ABC transporter permease [Armatimonadota bacterium]